MWKEFFSLPCKNSRLVFTVLLLFPGVACLTAADNMLSLERIDYITSVIDRYVENKENMSDNRVKGAIRSEIGRKMPLKPTKPMRETNLKALNEKARKIAVKQVGLKIDEVKSDLQKEAEKKYTMHKLRDSITLRIRRGGRVNIVRGNLYRVTAENLLVGNTTVLLSDLDELTRSKFDKNLNESLKEKYVEDGLQRHKRSLVNDQQKIFHKLLNAQNEENEKNGYIYVARDSRWLTAEQIVNYLLQEEEKIYLEQKAKEERILAEKRKKEAELARQREAEERRNRPAEPTVAPPEQRETEKTVQQRRIEKENPRGGERRGQNGEVMDMFAGDGSAIPVDTGGDFIAMSPQALAEAMRRRPVNEVAYKKLLERVDAQIREIGENYWGIDADQGYKKALWGFSETDVYYALSKEKEIAFLEKYTINRNDIVFPKGSRPARIYLYYFFGKLNELRIQMGDLTSREFKIFKDGLNAKYGKSNTQMKYGRDDIFHQIQAGTLTHDRLPVILPEAEQKKYTEKAAKQEEKSFSVMNIGKNTGSAVPFVVVWEGRISRGVLTFNYNPASGIYSNVVFHKKCFPERLEADRKKRAEEEAKKKAAAAKTKK